MSQDCGGRAGEVGTQNIIRKKCLISLECNSDPAFQKLFICTYTFILCNFHLFFFFPYILLVDNGSSEFLI